MKDKRRRQTESPGVSVDPKKTKTSGRARSWDADSEDKIHRMEKGTLGATVRCASEALDDCKADGVAISPSGFQSKLVKEAPQPSAGNDEIIRIEEPSKIESSASNAQHSVVRDSPTKEHLCVGISPAEEYDRHQKSSSKVEPPDRSCPSVDSVKSIHGQGTHTVTPCRGTEGGSDTSQSPHSAPRLWNISLFGDVATGATDIKVHGIPPDSEAAVMILINAICGVMDKSGANDAKPEPQSILSVAKTPRAPEPNMSKSTPVINTPNGACPGINSGTKSSSKFKRTTLIDTPAVSTKSRTAALATPLSTGTLARTPNTTYGNYTHAEVKAEIERAAAAVGETAPNKNRRDEFKAMYLLGQFELFDRTGDVYERVTKCSECVKRGKTSCFVVDEDRETVIVTQRCAWCLHDRKKCED